MNRLVLPLIVLFIFLSSCSEPPVKQIPVEVPANVAVPEGMVYIPAGKFIMGHAEDPKTAGGKKVNVKVFLIDRHEVSRGRYKKFDPKFSVNKGKEKYPMTHVDYPSAEKFCKSTGGRLPTEAEWEKAARGPDGRKWPWELYYEHPNNGFSGFIPEPVDKREEWISPYGLHGMGHNVWEWTSDEYFHKRMPVADRGKFKTIRGGLSQTHLTVKFTPAYTRNYMEPASRYNFLGFRCAKDIE